MEGAYEEAPAEGITGLPVQEGEDATGLEAAPPHEPEVEGHGVPAEGEPPVEEAPPASIWERKRISDLRTTMLHRNMDVSLLDSFLATVGDPLTKTGRSSKSEPRKRSVAGGGAAAGRGRRGRGHNEPRRHRRGSGEAPSHDGGPGPQPAAGGAEHDSRRAQGARTISAMGSALLVA